VGFARERLQRSGSVHESEIAAAFRQSLAKYRSQDAMPDDRIRDFIRNWHPNSQRTPNGFFKVRFKNRHPQHISYYAIHVLPTQHAQRCLLGFMTQLTRIEVWRIISVCAGAGRIPQAAHRPLQRRGVWHRWRPHCGRFVKTA